MEHLRVDLKFTLVHADGKSEPKPMDKVWYFEVPAKRADDKSMNELLHRIFWDQNVAMRQREPGDHAYLSMVSFKTSKVDLGAVKATKGTAADSFGWIAAQRDVVWESMRRRSWRSSMSTTRGRRRARRCSRIVRSG